MDLIRVAIDRPIAVIAAVLMIVMFGYVSLQTIPIQLTPDVNRPVIEIQTSWPGAAPAEIEREIVNRQEEVLRGLEGVEEMISESSQGEGVITLTFGIGTDMDRALLLTANRLDRVADYPEEADEPTLSTADSNDNAIAWFTLVPAPGNDRDVHTYGEFAEDVIKARLERVPGVAQANVYGGSEREMQVVVDPVLMARYRLTVPEVVQALREANISLTAGDVEEGKRRYIVRTEGEFEDLQQVRDVLVRSQGDGPAGALSRVTLSDIAEVRYGYKEPRARIRWLGQPALALNALRETGANVIEVMEGIRAAVDDLNQAAIPGQNLRFQQLYDETIYINSAIDLVQQNIIIGGALAAIMLLLFLRSGRATLVVSLAIPVSVIGSFVAMAALGRSINVISLAGLAFAVGMVVDAAIVVLENIFRLRQQGMPAHRAAYHGAAQVWGAVLVSALTTVMVFIPILVMDLEVGQLFRDIAVAISVSVLLSLLVAATVIPALSARLLGNPGVGQSTTRLRLPVIDDLAQAFLKGALAFTHAVVQRKAVALGVVALISVIAIGFTWRFLPQLEYLPEGNRNFIFGTLIPPPGYNLDTSTEIARRLEDAVRPHWASAATPENPAADPQINNFFFVALNNFSFIGASAIDERNAGALIPVLRGPIFSEPGTIGFMSQMSLFGRGLGGARSIELDISGGDLPTILGVARRAAGMVVQAMPFSEGHQMRPIPGLELGAPEIRVLPDRLRLADNGVTASALGATVDTFNDGLRVAEITVEGDRIDLMLRGPDNLIEQTQGIGAIPVVTADGMIVPVESLADVVVTAGPTQIRHSERIRTVTLEIRPAAGMALEQALNIVNDAVIAPLRAEGLPDGVTMQVTGTADQLQKTWNHMVLDLLLALVIVYLVMAVLFNSFWYPLIILISVPLAAAGGVAGLAVLNLFQTQALDMLTLLGFVILIGIVVNNAILLVHQSLYQYRHEGLKPEAAIVEATRNRVRPIFMSTLTSVFGMLPLVVFPGAGSELYRGLGSVVVGGLALSAVLTLLIIPPLMTVFMGLIESRTTRQGEEDETEAGEPAPAEARPKAAE
ncbi:MAG: MMPL family transporter [Alphaproteobacteria bacterium]|jgi:HAE1 family hydrophobic/amphiphilic exporter-1|nr:MMPL family transporter [Alphaproteobacteria bacterium]